MDLANKESTIYCGRGRAQRNCHGNQRFRQVIKDHSLEYSTSTRIEKIRMVGRILNVLTEEGLTFTKQDKHREWTVTLKPSEAKVKIGHALRDAVSEMTKKQERQAKKLAKKRMISPFSNLSSTAPSPCFTLASDGSDNSEIPEVVLSSKNSKVECFTEDHDPTRMNHQSTLQECLFKDFLSDLSYISAGGAEDDESLHRFLNGEKHEYEHLQFLELALEGVMREDQIMLSDDDLEWFQGELGQDLIETLA